MPTKSRIVDSRRHSVIKEATRIQQRARRGETVVVRLGVLIFFCANQDAWMLDLEDNFARCLMREGVAKPHGITETRKQFLIDWNADYTLEGDLFNWADRESGRLTSVMGYPVSEIQRLSGDEFAL